MTRHPVLPRPFNDPKSFTAIACGTERITVKPEWPSVFPEAPRADAEKTEPQHKKEAVR